MVLFSAAFALSACGDDPPPGPGLLTASIVSPNGAEGAALVELSGPGIESVSSIDGPVHSLTRGDTVRVAVFRHPAGALRFSVQVADTTAKPTGLILQVAGPDNALRSDVPRYDLEIVR